MMIEGELDQSPQREFGFQIFEVEVLWLPNIPSGRIPDDSEHYDMISIDDRDGQNSVVGFRLAAQIPQADSGRELDFAASAQHRVPFRTEEGAAS